MPDAAVATLLRSPSPSAAVAAPPRVRPSGRRRPLPQDQVVRELSWLVAGLPVWWLLGIEQFVFPVGTLWAARPLLTSHHATVRVARTTRWLGGFLVVFWCSSYAVSEPLRHVTFLRTFATYATAFLLLVVVPTVVVRWSAVVRLVRAVVLAVGVAAAAGLAAAAGVVRPDALSPFGRLVPDALAATGYGRQVVHLSLGAEEWFAGVGTYFRLDGFALYANGYATLLVVTVPLVVFAAVRAPRRWERVAAALVAVAALANLVLTTSRVAVASLVLGGAVAALLALWSSPRHRRLVLAGAAAAVLVALALLIARGAPDLPALATEIGYARGAGSIEGRTAVYRTTLAGWAERPLLGWGTERDVPALPYPAGSHSLYLGVLYAQGALGLAALGGCLLALWGDTRPVVRGPGSATTLLWFGRWSLIAGLLDGLTNNPSLDGTAMFLVWLTYGLVVAARRLSRGGVAS